MNRFIFLFFVVIALSSCVNYQYVSLSSDLPQTTDTKHYYLSDSLVYVDFDFNGDYFPVRILFINESDDPVLVDLKKTVFVENGSVLSTAYGLMEEDVDEMVPVPGGKSIGFEFRPFYSEFEKDLKKSSGYVELYNDRKRIMVTGSRLEEGGRELEIHLVYHSGDSFDNRHSLVATFREDFIYFSEKRPGSFPGGMDPDCYYISKESQGGLIAADLFMELATISLYYYLMAK